MTSDTSQPDDRSMPDDQREARLRRVEEAAGFNEHTIEQLSAHMLALSRTMDTMVRRLASLERRLAKLSEAGDAGGPGGDATGPDDAQREANEGG
jgi:uncharacterized coiled-coil protein SlyX